MDAAGHDPDSTVVRERYVPNPELETSVVRAMAAAAAASLLPLPPRPARPPVADELITIVNPGGTAGPAAPTRIAPPVLPAASPPGDDDATRVRPPVPVGSSLGLPLPGVPGLPLAPSAPERTLDAGQTMRPLAPRLR